LFIFDLKKNAWMMTKDGSSVHKDGCQNS